MTHEPTAPETAFPPTLEGNLAFWEQQLDRLAAEAPAIAGSNKYPEWWYGDENERLRDIVPELKAKGADLSTVSRYYELFDRESLLKVEITGYPRPVHPIAQLSFNLGDDLLGKALGAEPVDGPMHIGILDDLVEATEQQGYIGQELIVLKTAFGLQNATELLGICLLYT